MINSKELRIGNWIYSKTYDKEIQMKSFFGLCNIEFNPELFKPIPLTEEWLLKFGFEIVFIKNFKHLKIEINDNDLFLMERIDLPKYSIWINKNNLGFCEYVHQLQNLYFAITGEELYEK